MDRKFEETMLMERRATDYISVEEYFLLEEAAPEKHEYFSGNVTAMAGATEEHNSIVSNIIGEVRNKLKGKDCKIFPSDLRVTTPAGKSYFYPDASIVCGPTQKQAGVFDTLLNPVVIFEVISEGTEKIDRGYKFFYYQQIPSLQEYVLVDSRTYFIEVIRRQADGLWQFDKYKKADGSFMLNAIDASLSFEEIYDQVQIPEGE
jgi:Uma2 family endonuclease